MKAGIPYSGGSGRWLTGMAGALLTFGTLMAQETFRITRVEPLADRLELSWQGNPSLDYFEVQRWDGQFPENREPILLSEHRSVSLEREGLQGFLRIAAIAPPGPVTPISDSRRHEILDAVAEQVVALPGDDAEADAVAVAAILRSYPEIEAVSLSAGGSVSARFRDGRRLLIVNVRPAGAPREASAARPVSRRAMLFQVKGMGIESPMLQVLAPAFEQAGYQVHAQEASLANFLAFTDFGNDIGVFYVDAHGGILREPIHTKEIETGRRVFPAPGSPRAPPAAWSAPPAPSTALSTGRTPIPAFRPPVISPAERATAGKRKSSRSCLLFRATWKNTSRRNLVAGQPTTH